MYICMKCVCMYLYLYLYECMSRHTATETPVELAGVQEYWVCVRVCGRKWFSIFGWTLYCSLIETNAGLNYLACKYTQIIVDSRRENYAHARAFQVFYITHKIEQERNVFQIQYQYVFDVFNYENEKLEKIIYSTTACVKNCTHRVRTHVALTVSVYVTNFR